MIPSARNPFAIAGPLRNPLHSLRSDEPDAFEAPRSLTSAVPGMSRIRDRNGHA
jgi:hypothetical protein